MNPQPAERRTVLLGTHKTHALQIYYYVSQTPTGRQIILTDNPHGGPRSHFFPSPILPSHVTYAASVDKLIASTLIDFYDHGKYYPGTLIPLSASSIDLALLKTHDPLKLLELFFLDPSKKMCTPSGEFMRVMEAAFLTTGWRINLQAAIQARVEFEGGRVGSPIFAGVWMNALPVKVDGWSRNEKVDEFVGHQWLDREGNLCLKYNPPGSLMAQQQQQQQRAMNVDGTPQGNRSFISPQQQRVNEQYVQHPQNERNHNRAAIENGRQQPQQQHPQPRTVSTSTENKRKNDSPHPTHDGGALPFRRGEHSRQPVAGMNNTEPGSASQASKKVKTSHPPSDSPTTKKEKRKESGTSGFVDLTD